MTTEFATSGTSETSDITSTVLIDCALSPSSVFYVTGEILLVSLFLVASVGTV